MKIESRAIGDLRPYDQNPRCNDQAVDAVARSIQEFGFRQPVVVDEHGVVVVGHTRLLAAKQLGLKEVPVHVASDLTPDQARAYRIADNQTATIADWDYDLLPAELAGLQAADYDLDLLGFSNDELEQLLRPATAEEAEDEAPPLPDDPVSKLGEVYELGPHRLMVGDATSQSDVEKLLLGDRADLLLTDPPYGVGYVGKTKDALTIENDQMSDQDFAELLRSSFANADAAMNPGASFYIWHADSGGFTFRGACYAVGWPVRQCLVWAKSVLVMGRQDYQWKHEPCLYGWKPGKGHQWLSDRKQTTVLEFDKPSRNADHPTMKPVAMFEYLIRNSAKKGQIVIDLFGGSGTTLIAAERSGRVARIMELDPRYADVIRRRWEQHTCSTTA